MARELLLASFISAVWLAICFLCAGAAYVAFGEAVGVQRLMEIEAVFGKIVFPGGVTSIARLSMYYYVVAMILACMPVNLYWMMRLRKEKKGSFGD